MSYTNPILALEQQRQLLALEHEAEKAAFQRQTAAVGIGRKVRRGEVWWPVTVGRAFWNSLNQYCVELRRKPGDEQDHLFEYGRPVAFFTMAVPPCGEQSSPSAPRYLSLAGQVSVVDGDRMVVTVSGEGDAEALRTAGAGLGVQLSFDETSYRVMDEALVRVINARQNRLAELRDLFYTDAPAEAFTFADPDLPWLNAVQQRAVGEVLRAKDVAVVHGPPGTGKTTTLVEAIVECLRRENQVLVCAQSNMAVDWISEKLQERGVPVLRIGNPTRVTDTMLASTYERQFEAHPDYPELWAIRKALRQARQKRKRGAAGHEAVARLRERATELETRITADLFREARVIASTLIGSANRLLDGQRFATLFIDEAAQALEAACWVALRRAGRVILAGDHCQLPPTVKSLDAMRGGLAVTLMERIVKQKPSVVTLLTTQYRMNDLIMRFSSEWFYGGRVRSADEVRGRSVLDFDTPILWIDTADMDCREQYVGERYGRVNPTEARLTVAALLLYINKVGARRFLDEGLDVGIISPYRAQVQHLRHLLAHEPQLKQFRHRVTINTVDGFQGQERDIVLISLVRANDRGEIGFLRDLRRMNVAITRARMKLIILGDTATLCRHPFYRRLYDYIDAL